MRYIEAKDVRMTVNSRAAWSINILCAALLSVGCDGEVADVSAAGELTAGRTSASMPEKPIPSEAAGSSNVQDALPADDFVADGIVLDPPTKASPVSAAAGLSDAQAQAGQTRTLIVKVQTAAGWHIYAVDRPAGPAARTTLKLVLPPDVDAAGDWSYPQPQPNFAAGAQPGHIYEGTVRFQCPLKVKSGAAPGERKIQCELGYQACDAFSCRPPAAVMLETRLEVVQSPDEGN